jgi:hypothetical protein
LYLREVRGRMPGTVMAQIIRGCTNNVQKIENLPFASVFRKQ